MDVQIERFLVFIVEEKGLTVNTAKAYRNDLKQFDIGLGPTNGSARRWDRVSEKMVLEHILGMRLAHYAEASVARRVTCIKSFFQFLEAEGVVSPETLQGVKTPKVERVPPTILSATEVGGLLEQTMKQGTAEASRDRAMLEVLYTTGLRVTELVSLDVEDICLNGAESSISCRTKGKERTLPITEQTGVAVVDYMLKGRPEFVKTRQQSALFVNRYGYRITRQGFWLILKQYAKAAKISTPVTPTTLRHSFTAHKLGDGVRVGQLQELLGHVNISTTNLYARDANKRSRAQTAAATA